MIIEGKSEKPVYLWLKDARELWGRESKETQTIIKAELADEHIQVVSIALAGENMVHYARIMEGLHDSSDRGTLH